MNPDCKASKHHACAGDAWDDETDSPTTCACPCHTTPAGRRRPEPPRPGTERITGL